MKCSICKGKNRKATCESVANPGTYYCNSCETYVVMEYGSHKVKPLTIPKKKLDTPKEILEPTCERCFGQQVIAGPDMKLYNCPECSGEIS